MPINRGRQHGAKKAAKIISRNFAKLHRRSEDQQSQIEEISNCTVDVMDRQENHGRRIKRLERNLDHATDMLSEEIDGIRTRIVGLALAIVALTVILATAIVIVWSRTNA